MIDRTPPLPVVQQCQLLGVARSTGYYQLTPVVDSELALMRRIDELHLPYLFAGVWMLRELLRHDRQALERRCVACLMRRMGITSVYRTPCTTQWHPAQACSRGWQKTNYADWLPTGSWSAAPLESGSLFGSPLYALTEHQP